MSVCRVTFWVVGRGCLLWPVHPLGKMLLAFSLLHSVLQGQICLLLWLSLPIFAFQSHIMKRTSFGVSVLEGLVGLHRTVQLQLLQHYLLGHQFSSVQFSRSVMSESLWPHESQHSRPPCPSPTPGVHTDSRPSSQWCHPAISSSVFPFSSCPKSLTASASFWVNQLFLWGGQSIGVSASASVLPMTLL